MQLWSCVLWRSGWLLTNRGQLSWINDWIIQWRRHRYHMWWQIIALWVSLLSIKAPVITRSVLWISGSLLTDWGHLRWIDNWIIQWRRQSYQGWWKLVDLWVTVLAIKAPVITRINSLIFFVPCSIFVVTNNTLWKWHDECNMCLWRCCVPVILFVEDHQKVRANVLAQQLQLCLSFSTRNQKNYEIFVSI